MRAGPSVRRRSACVLVAGLALTACGGGGGGGGSGDTVDMGPAGGSGGQGGMGGMGGAGGQGGQGGMGGAGGQGGQGGTGGAGGQGGMGGTGGMPPPTHPVAMGVESFDSVPSPDGTKAYFTSQHVGDENHPADDASLYVADVEGGGAPQELASGFIAPLGLAVSLDGATVFVADPTFEDAQGATGAIFTVPAAGGMPTPLMATVGRDPRGMDVAGDGNGVLYFTGRNPANGAAGVYSMDPAGGEVTPVLEGDPLVDPSGVVALPGGDLLVADSIGGGGQILRISGGHGQVLAAGLRLGYPSGITVTLDGMTAAISGRNPDTGHAAIYTLDLTNNMLTVVNDPAIADQDEPGGLHRAHAADVFTWCGVTAGTSGSGVVFRVTLF